MPIKAVQQFMLGTVLSNENEARQTLAAMKAAGYDGIELCGFMIHPIGFMVRQGRASWLHRRSQSDTYP